MHTQYRSIQVVMIPISVAHSWFGGKLGSQTKAVVWRVPKPGSQNDVAAKRFLEMLMVSCWISLIQATYFGQHKAFVGKMYSPISPSSGSQIPIVFFRYGRLLHKGVLPLLLYSDHTILHGNSASTHMTELCIHDYILDMLSGIWISMKVVDMLPSPFITRNRRLIITLRQGQSQFGEISRHRRHPGSEKTAQVQWFLLHKKA